MCIQKLIYLRFSQIILVLRLFVAKLFSFFHHENDLWLISERGHEARDNAFFFFLWLKNKHPEINVKYVISKDSQDYSKLLPWKDCIIHFDSFKHLKSIWWAKYLISTHICGYTNNHQFFALFDNKFNIFRGKKKVFLQHGIIKDNLVGLYHDNVNLDLFICGSQIEYNYVLDNFGYPNNIVRYTGLCRFDNLVNAYAKKQVLLMPTFRIYIDRDHFESSEYFSAYKELLCSEKISSLLLNYGYELIFYPHFEFQSKIHLFKNLPLPENVKIADMTYDVQTLLKESEILITDFSSVFFDVMYMNKPILFYQFDEQKYRSSHYQKGYLNYEDVGPVLNTLDEVVDSLNTILIQKKVSDKYQNYYDATFLLRDKNNCERVYEAILNC